MPRPTVALTVALTTLVLVGPVFARGLQPETLVMYGSDHTWTGSGTFSDSGTWSTNRAALGGLPSPVEGSFTLFFSLVGAQGTIDFTALLEFNGVQEQDLCRITGGTGAYANVRGQGRWVETWDENGRFISTCDLALEPS